MLFLNFLPKLPSLISKFFQYLTIYFKLQITVSFIHLFLYQQVHINAPYPFLSSTEAVLSLNMNEIYA